MTQTTETTKTIQMIPTKRIRPHPENPRRDLGDLTELADSIRENGVLQNLTVVPIKGELTGQNIEGCYRCVVGHRRLAAAMMAGLDVVPCIVSDMTENQQRITMFTENMQRTDLTIWEQAYGLQTMIDLGETVASLAQKTGISESTVRRRVRLTELDKDAFEKAEQRGATLKDYAELEKIESLELKNKVLATIGTKNFDYTLRNALADEQLSRGIATWELFLSKFATKESFSYQNHRTIYSVRVSESPDEKGKIPEDADVCQYFYEIDKYGWCRLFRDKNEDDDKPVEREINPEEQERRARMERLKNLASVADQTRNAFVDNYPQAQAKKNVKHILGFLLSNMLDDDGDWVMTDVDVFTQAMDISLPEECNDAAALVAPALEKSVERNLLALAWATKECGSDDYCNWRGDYEENGELDRVYAFLEGLGYELADEERQFKDGTHPLQKHPDPVDGEDGENE